MEVFVLSRARGDLADEEADRVTEEHWAYMDRFASAMVARGPLLGPDRETWKGSLHIVDLPDAEAARRFVDEEPYHRAGLFAEHVVRRFGNRLGRTMWAFPGAVEGPRFLVLGDGEPPALPAERLIVDGRLSGLEDARPAGFALALHAPSAGAVRELIGSGEAEIVDWELGGRR